MPALAEEVERWAADEPVTAYREPFARRARWWAKRHRTAVTGVAVALAAGVIGLSGVLAVQTRARTALAAANSDLTRSKAAVQARYDLAVDAIKTFHTGVSEDFLLKQDQFKELRDRLLKSAAGFYGKLGAQLGEGTDAASRRALAQAEFEMAELTAKVGRKEDALAVHRAVLARREALAADPAADPETKADVGRSLTAVAYVLSTIGKTGEAEATYRKAEALLADLSRTAPSAAQAALASCRTLLGDLLSETGKSLTPWTAYRLARADQEAPAAVPGATNEARHELAETIIRDRHPAVRDGEVAGGGGRVPQGAGYPAEAGRRQSRRHPVPITAWPRQPQQSRPTCFGIWASRSRRRPSTARRWRSGGSWLRTTPPSGEFRSSLARRPTTTSASCVKYTGRPAEAEAEYREALAIRRKLVDDNPADTEFRNRLAVSHNNLGILLSQTGKPSEAEAEYREALAIRRKLADDNPAVTDFRSGLAQSHNSLGSLLAETGKLAEAEAEFRGALAVFQKLADEDPAITDYRSRLAGSHHEPRHPAVADGQAVGGGGRVPHGRWRSSGSWPTTTPPSPAYRGSLAYSHCSLGILLSQTGRPTEAEAEIPREEAVCGLFQEQVDNDPVLRDYSANCQTNMADLFRKAGRRDEARAACERARALREPLVRDHPQVTAYRGGLAHGPADRANAPRRGGPGRCVRRLEAGRRALRRTGVPRWRTGVFPVLLPRGPGGARRPAGVRSVGRGGTGRVGPGHDLAAPGRRARLPQPGHLPPGDGPRPAPRP